MNLFIKLLLVPFALGMCLVFIASALLAGIIVAPLALGWGISSFLIDVVAIAASSSSSPSTNR